MIGLLMPGMTHAQSFIDLPSNHKHYTAVSNLSSRGILKGYETGGFSPSGHINRAEMVKVLMEATRKHEVGSTLNYHKDNSHWYADFADVPVDIWFAPYVDLAHSKGVVAGYDDGLFHPDGTVNFAEALKMVIEAYGLDYSRIIFRPNQYHYVNANDWFARYFTYAASRNMINNRKFYHPGQAITRGEFAELVYRAEIVRSRGGKAFIETEVATSNEYRITIPRLGIVDHSIEFADPYDGASALELLRRVPFGHYLAGPGHGKKFVLFAHSSAYAWDQSPFKVVLRQIDQLQDGDMIYINYREKAHAYRVANRQIIPQEQDYIVMEDYGREELAMYTCWPPDSISHRYVIHADPVF